MKLFGRDIGVGNPVLIVAEAGICHQGSLETARRMVDVAAGAGADIIKFQKRDMETLYRKDVLADPSKESHSLGVYIPILKKCELSKEDHRNLKDYCSDKGIHYLCSPWDIESVKFLDSIDVEAYKIPSACFSDVYLLDYVSKMGKPVIFSTGMHSEEEINRLMPRYLEIFKDRIALMHCVSSYPTANRDVNLGYMDTLRDRFNIPIGWSGHERGIPITVAAVARGANIIERHFTLDRTQEGPDHAASLEPHGLETMIRHIRAVEESLGCTKKVNQGEIVARETLGKILTWNRNHKKGDKIQDDSFTSTSPGYGLPAYKGFDFMSEGDLYISRDIDKGDPVFLDQGTRWREKK